MNEINDRSILSHRNEARNVFRDNYLLYSPRVDPKMNNSKSKLAKFLNPDSNKVARKESQR